MNIGSKSKSKRNTDSQTERDRNTEIQKKRRTEQKTDRDRQGMDIISTQVRVNLIATHVKSDTRTN